MSFEQISNHTEKKPKILYHASSNREITRLEVKGERTRDPNEKPSIFATPNKALASVFIVPTDDSWTHSGLINDIPFIVISDRERFNELDQGGTIYSFGSSQFESDPDRGLRENEYTTIEPVDIEGHEHVNSALDAMLKLGVQVYFCLLYTSDAADE